MLDLKYRLPKGTVPSLSIVLCERRCWTSSIVSRRGRYPHLASSSARDDAGPQVSSPEGDGTLTEHRPPRETMLDLKYRLPKGTVPSLIIVLCERRCWTQLDPKVSSPEGDDTLTEHRPLRETMLDLKYRLPKGTIPSLSIVLRERRCRTRLVFT